MEKTNETATDNAVFFNRDLSWLSFNGRVLEEASRQSVPLLERIKFLSIFSSNLDEFYRVRMPVLQALRKIDRKNNLPEGPEQYSELLTEVRNVIGRQQEDFGRILTGYILPSMKQNGIHVVYNEPFPEEIRSVAENYFFSRILTFLSPVTLNGTPDGFFPENNKLYFLLQIQEEPGGPEKRVVLNLPSDHLPRFFTAAAADGTLYVTFIDDIIRLNISSLFKGSMVNGCYSFKVTRDAELDLADEYPGDLTEQIGIQLRKRDYGLATRFLHEPGMPAEVVEDVRKTFNLRQSAMMEGGRYHNLKDLTALPATNPGLKDAPWLPVQYCPFRNDQTVFDRIAAGDVVFHPPYHSYDCILRFFNEAATDRDVTEIYVTLYRVANNSAIVNALITAARNGKKVHVVVELKARFDEENNIRWAKKMREAGIKLTYSITALKVHAKIVLVKRNVGDRLRYTGLLATGNFNESTATVYTDHILMTAHPGILRELELLFIFLSRKERPVDPGLIRFRHLLVAQFNLQGRFTELIDREIAFARAGKPAFITIKMNNLEEKTLISKLYEASRAGVEVNLIIRGICCLVPDVPGLSERITIKRIVGRYLEHGRIFIFHNNGDQEVFMGSADWMNRNIYRRIEVCFPVTDEAIKNEITKIIDLQLADTIQAVTIDAGLRNVPVENRGPAVHSQFEIYRMLKQKIETDGYVR